MRCSISGISKLFVAYLTMRLYESHKLCLRDVLQEQEIYADLNIPCLQVETTERISQVRGRTFALLGAFATRKHCRLNVSSDKRRLAALPLRDNLKIDCYYFLGSGLQCVRVLRCSFHSAIVRLIEEWAPTPSIPRVLPHKSTTKR